MIPGGPRKQRLVDDAKAKEQAEQDDAASRAEAVAQRKLDREQNEKAEFMSKYRVKPSSGSKKPLKTKHILQVALIFTLTLLSRRT